MCVVSNNSEKYLVNPEKWKLEKNLERQAISEKVWGYKKKYWVTSQVKI